MFEPGASPQPVSDGLRLLFAKKTQWVCEGVEKICVGFQQRNVKARKEDRVRIVSDGLAILRTGEPAIHLFRPQICWW